MSDSLTFNKYAGALLGTGFVIALLINASGIVFSQDKVAKPGFKVQVAEETGGGAAAPEVPPDWGTVLKTADVAAGQATFTVARKIAPSATAERRPIFAGTR